MNIMQNPASTIDNESSDAGLWRRVLENDQSAFEEVVRRHQGAVTAVAYCALGDFSAAQDVAQETFWQSWRSRADLKDHDKLPGWLCGIARNLARNNFHTGRRLILNTTVSDNEPTSLEYDPASNAVSDEEQRLVWETLEQIPESYREALVLFYRHGHSVAEVASSLDISEVAAKQRLSRGRDILREQLANLVEGVLVRTRPNDSFRKKVMAGIAALTTAMNISSASTASASGVVSGAVTTTVAQSTITTLASTAIKTATGAASATGIAGGLLGAGAGLGGAWFGCWLPAQLAPTMAERRLIERAGRTSMFISLLFVILNFVLLPLVWLNNGWLYYLVGILCVTVAFITSIIFQGMRTQNQIRQLRSTLQPDAMMNDSHFKQRLERMGWLQKEANTKSIRVRGRKWTSKSKLLGIPLVDIYFSDFVSSPTSDLPQRVSRRAYGWIAIGDSATGILLAIGAYARGLIAFGGVTLGVVSIGGMSVGAISLGGIAAGILGLGGIAIGYDSIGGLAIGGHSAIGGGAIAYYLAYGGGALAHDYAVGGAAIAAETNTPLAKELLETKSYLWIMSFYIKNLTLCNTIVIIASLIPAMAIPFIYRRDNDSDS